MKRQYDEGMQSIQRDLEASALRVQQLQTEIKQYQERPDLSEYVTQLQNQNEELRKVGFFILLKLF